MMRSSWLSVIVGCTVIIMGGLWLDPSAAAPPPLRPGTVRVTVIDRATSEPIPQAVVSVRSQTDGSGGPTDAKGEVVFDSLPSWKDYELEVTHSNYLATPNTKFLLGPAETLSYTIKLNPKGVKATGGAVKFHLFAGVNPADRYTLEFQNLTLDMSPTQIRDQVAIEAPVYKGVWNLVEDGREIRVTNSLLPGYRIAANVPTKRQLCGGLVLSQLLGGPYPVPTQSASSGQPSQLHSTWEVVQKFGRRPGSDPNRRESVLPKEGDVAVWRRKDEVTHFAWVSHVEPSGRFVVISKDTQERVYEGYADTFPKLGYGDVAFYRLDWDSIHCYREGDPDVSVPDFSGKAIRPDAYEWGYKRISPASRPRPRFQNAFLEACDEVTKELGLPDYRIHFHSPQLAWGAEWATSEGVGPTSIFTGRYRLILIGPMKSVQAAREAVQQEKKELWLRDPPVVSPPSRKLLLTPSLKDFVIEGEKGFQAGPTLNTPTGYTLAYVTSLDWSCGTYYLRVSAELDRRQVLRESDEAITAQREARMKISAERAAKMRDIFAKVALDAGLNLPERPAGFPGLPSQP